MTNTNSTLENTTPRIVDYAIAYLLPLIPQKQELHHLDIGAGWGHLIAELKKARPLLRSEGCDYNPQHNELQEVQFKHVDLNEGVLPYADQSFDLITCTEVLEHVENFRQVVREISRVCKPGARVLITTPNVLNLRSRFYFLTRGLFEYFDPYPLTEDHSYYPGERHITPIPFYYLGHALLDSGFHTIQASCDREQRFSRGLGWLLIPLFRAIAQRNLSRRRKKLKFVADEIEALALEHNARSVLMGRTLFVTAIRR